MITFTSSSAKRRSALAVAALGWIAGCGQPGGAPAQARDHPPAASESHPASPRTSAPRTADPAAAYTADLTRAVAGDKKVAFPATASFGGMTCSPTRIDGASARTRALTLILPQSAAARRHVLAVVTPERGLLEVYTPFPRDTEVDDIMIPSQAISWAKARTQNRFAVSSDQLDGLRPGADRPEPLFIEAGRYRFALVNGIDAGVLKANGAKVQVSAGCTFDWTP